MAPSPVANCLDLHIRYRKVNEQTGRDDFEKLDSAWAKVESRKLKVYLAPYKTKLPRGKYPRPVRSMPGTTLRGCEILKTMWIIKIAPTHLLPPSCDPLHQTLHQQRHFLREGSVTLGPGADQQGATDAKHVGRRRCPPLTFESRFVIATWDLTFRF